MKVIFKTMLDNFTSEYKQIMLDAEHRAKQFGYSYIIPEDILIQISKLSQGAVAKIFMDFGINEGLLLDIFSRPPFNVAQENRTGEYMGISERLREIIKQSIFVASKFSKKQAGVEDFLLALLGSPEEKWFMEFLDFVGIVPRLLENELVHINTNFSQKNMAASEKMDEVFGPIDEIMNMIEDHFGELHHSNNSQNPGVFSQNPPQERKESKTPALDFFGADLVAEAKEKK